MERELGLIIHIVQVDASFVSQTHVDDDIFVQGEYQELVPQILSQRGSVFKQLGCRGFIPVNVGVHNGNIQGQPSFVIADIDECSIPQQHLDGVGVTQEAGHVQWSPALVVLHVHASTSLHKLSTHN